LGSLEVLTSDGWQSPSAPKRRRALAALVLEAGNVLSTDRLADAIWGHCTPNSAAKVVQNHVLGLRRAFGSHAIATRAAGYSIDREGLVTDAFRFESLAYDGRRALHGGRNEYAIACFDEALGLWRGTPYVDLLDWPAAASARARLDELYALITEDVLHARIESGDHLRAVGDLEAAVTDEPLRERRWRLLMLALYRGDRQSDALAAYQRARALLIEQLGIEPGSALSDMERAVLAHDSVLDGPVSDALDNDPVEISTFEREVGKAESAVARGDYLDAIRSYRAILAAYAEAGDGSREAELLVRLGAAERLAGHDAHRATLGRAFDLALHSDNPRTLAAAALAGVQRAGARSTTVVDHDLEALLATALDRAAPDGSDRVRLAGALAQELSAESNPVRRRSLADQALADARRARSPAILSEVLSRRATTLAGPDLLEDRLATTAENVRICVHVRDPIARWGAVRTRFHTVLESGDLIEAEQRLAQLRTITAETGAAAAAFGLAIDEAMRLLLSGNLEAADVKATEAYTLGAAHAHPDAFALYSGQLLEIRRAQGRLGELESLLDTAVISSRDRSATPALFARALCELDRPDEAAILLDENLLRLDHVVPSHLLTAMFAWAEVAVHTQRTTAMGILRARLTPYGRQICFNGCWVVGSVSHALGMLNGALGQHTEAEARFSEAERAHRDLDAPVLLERTQHERRYSCDV
jgi:DNA-binding SARP family transcriptional activator